MSPMPSLAQVSVTWLQQKRPSIKIPLLSLFLKQICIFSEVALLSHVVAFENLVQALPLLSLFVCCSIARQI